MVEWTEKYRPKRLDDVIGNRKAIEDLKKWAKSWIGGIPSKKAVVIMGDPGIGKTTTALALANDMGWQALEMNASDTRNAGAIMSIATQGALGETFTDTGEFASARDGKRKIIILDEADNIFGREDLGGIKAIAQTILDTKQPIILIVNDWYALKKRSSVIEKNVMTIRFSKPQKGDIMALLRSISRKEGVEVPEDVLIRLTDKCEGDVRSALKDLQSISEGRTKVELKNMSALGDRDTNQTMFQAMEFIFNTGNCKLSAETARKLDENPESLILWIDHNIPSAYRDPKDVYYAYEALSRADIYLGRVRRRQYYGLWNYASQMMSAGVSLAKGKGSVGRINYNFPLYLVKMSRSKGKRALRNEFGAKLARLTHTSKKRALQDILPFFKHLYIQDPEFRTTITRRLGLSDEEVGFLLDAKPDSHPVKHVFDAMRKVDAANKPEKDEDEEDSEEEKKPSKRKHSGRSPPEEEPEPQQEKKDEQQQQRNLFDFR